ncbi:ferredoxin-thioredoxin reductase catalytic domain-containing protein [Methanococcoides sp. NM1]|uniref:ferredoxin-thioredoxin reductase catalytic domain-containing protein n=1 Tax=Methanococcoides sp. NM1 TaxID=1201013 RepID=UPI0010836822|nr:ferredoxin-thioredoxin reductase catalytic domain-containing protein [Methanococcoides sp. NM1]
MNEHERLKEQLYELGIKYAEKKGYRLNSDKEILDTVIDGLAENKEKYGKRYCPCRIVTGDEEEDKKIICPCIYLKEEIENDGMCHCELFFKKDEDE